MLRRRHPQLGIIGRDPRDQLALVRLSRDDDRRAVGRSEQPLPEVEPQVRLALVLIGPMALVARLRKDRPDLPVEINSPGRIAGPSRARKHEQNHAGGQPRGTSQSHLRLLSRRANDAFIGRAGGLEQPCVGRRTEGG